MGWCPKGVGGGGQGGEWVSACMTRRTINTIHMGRGRRQSKSKLLRLEMASRPGPASTKGHSETCVHTHRLQDCSSQSIINTSTVLSRVSADLCD